MNNAKFLYEKMNDYKRFGLTSLSLCSFLYLGAVIPMEGKTILKTYILMGGTGLLLLLSITFFSISSKCRKILNESE